MSVNSQSIPKRRACFATIVENRGPDVHFTGQCSIYISEFQRLYLNLQGHVQHYSLCWHSEKTQAHRDGNSGCWVDRRERVPEHCFGLLRRRLVCCFLSLRFVLRLLPGYEGFAVKETLTHPYGQIRMAYEADGDTAKLVIRSSFVIRTPSEQVVSGCFLETVLQANVEGISVEDCAPAGVFGQCIQGVLRGH